MSAALELFQFHTQDIRVVLIDGEPWFVAADIAKALGYRDAWNLVRRLDEDEKGTHSLSTPSGDQNMTVISESGLYIAILGSQVEGAREFKRWVTRVVLPQIRKTGSYGVPSIEPPTVERLTPLEYAKKLVDAEMRAEEGAQFKRAIEGGNGLGIRLFHKKYFSMVPEHVFFEHLYSKSLLIDQRGKGSLRTTGSKAGTHRDGSQHRHPGYKGKQYFYMHGARDRGGVRRENAHVLPGEPELALRDLLVSQGLPANENTNGQYALTAREES
jgi:prophage antirepressor-like protein